MTEDKYKSIKPLDCILFGESERLKNIISQPEKYTIGIDGWVHAGIVVNRKIMPSLKVSDDDLYIWENTLSSTNELITHNKSVDAETQQPIFGVQIRKLSTVIEEELKIKTRVGWGRLKNHPVITSEFIKRIDTLHKRYYQVPFSRNIFRILSCSCFKPQPENSDKFFINFVSHIYNELSMIPLPTPEEILKGEISDIYGLSGVIESVEPITLE